MKEVNGLKLEDFNIGQLFDEEGYHCDSELIDFRDDGEGSYSITVKNLGRSDKTVVDELKAGDFIEFKTK